MYTPTEILLFATEIFTLITLIYSIRLLIPAGKDYREIVREHSILNNENIQLKEKIKELTDNQDLLEYTVDVLQENIAIVNRDFTLELQKQCTGLLTYGETDYFILREHNHKGGIKSYSVLTRQ